MIWPQQYHKEKQGSRWPEEGSIDVTFWPLFAPQQRVPDVNPESPTDATRGVGEQWRVENGYLVSPDGRVMAEQTEAVAVLHDLAALINSLNKRGVGDDPIPQRECEHKVWLTYPGWANVRCCEACPAIKLAGSDRVYLPQPIDPRSEAR